MRTAAAVAAFSLAGCLHGSSHAEGWTVRGDGQKTTEVREVPDFDAVELLGAVDATVKVGPARSVAVVIDANLQPHVLTSVEDGRLVVRTEGDLDWRGEGRVEIALPALRALRAAGSGDAVIEGGAGGDLALSTSGSGDLRWRGEARRLVVSTSGSGDLFLSGRVEASTSGSGDLRARDLSARDASIQTSGSGDAEVTLAGGSLSAASSGSGDVSWWGEGSVVAASVAGSGKIRRR